MPFLHLSANIIERRYGLSEADAGNRASLLMAGSIFLYPIVGFLTDRLKTATVVHKMFVLSSVLTTLCYAWLCLPPEWTRTPTPALVAFGSGQGFATLLLVIIVPHLVPIKYVSSALGVHKALEQTGSTISQTLAGLLLDKTRDSVPDTPNNLHAIAILLRVFLAINICQLVAILGMWRMQVVRDRRAAAASGALDTAPPGTNKGYMALPIDEQEDILTTALEDAPSPTTPINTVPKRYTGSAPSSQALLAKPVPAKRRSSRGTGKMAHSHAERRRGKLFVLLCAAAIGCAWVLFMVVAWEKLDEKRE